MRPAQRPSVAPLALLALLAGCTAAAGGSWVREAPPTGPATPQASGWTDLTPQAPRTLPPQESAPEDDPPPRAPLPYRLPSPPPPLPREAPLASEAAPSPEEPPEPRGEPPVTLRLRGTPRFDASTPLEPGLFRNTYYEFPAEEGGPRDATLFNGDCIPIARVTQAFHDRVCVQGSGRLASGATVSFQRRDCACAALCPRTGQRVCFERLDPARFPAGRGAAGTPIHPLRSVAVDVAVIPLGTPLFIPEFVGLPRADGSPHDGCFIAEDRGIKVVGRHVDVFMGDPSMTARWNALVPSNRGVRVLPRDPRCLP